MKVMEIFSTIQGEGLFSGAVTLFVRTAGCSLRCPECDTKYAWENKDIAEVGAPFVIDQILDICARPRHICITGGEPFEQPKSDLFNLLQIFHGWVGRRGLQSVVIETNGAQDVSWLFGKPFRPITHLSVDYKLPSSGKQDSMIFSNFTKLGSTDVIKFICANPDDVAFAGGILQKLAGNVESCPVILFHSLGGQPANFLPRMILGWEGLLERFDIRVGVQLHKLFRVR